MQNAAAEPATETRMRTATAVFGCPRQSRTFDTIEAVTSAPILAGEPDARGPCQPSAHRPLSWPARHHVPTRVGMGEEKNGFVWPLASESTGVQLRWHRLGSVTWLADFASFPRGPDEPGIYLVKLTARGRYRIYNGGG